jgi:hypothetical protein
MRQCPPKTSKLAGSATHRHRDARFPVRLTTCPTTAPDIASQARAGHAPRQPGAYPADDAIKVGQCDGIRKSKRAHIFPKEPDGHYVEPAWCSARLFAVDHFGPPRAIIFDPACGFGTILRTAQDAGYQAVGADIVDRRRADLGLDIVPFFKNDFLSCDPPILTEIISIVCNPPFDYVQQCCERALAIANYKVAMIFLLRRLPAARWLTHLPLETVYLLTPRPSIPPGAVILAGEKPGGGSQDFCWLVFNKIGTRHLPKLSWLNRDGDLLQSRTTGAST